jgi:hypothetical protein
MSKVLVYTLGALAFIVLLIVLESYARIVWLLSPLLVVVAAVFYFCNLQRKKKEH